MLIHPVWNLLLAAFNTVGLEHLGVPDGSRIDGRQLTMLFAGGPPDSKVAVADVVAAVGFKPKVTPSQQGQWEGKVL